MALTEADFEVLVDAICLAQGRPHRGTCDQVARGIVPEVEAIIARHVAALVERVATLLPAPPVVADDGMIRHDTWSHSAGLACDLCPGWPHTHCVSAAGLRAVLGDEAGL